MPRLTALDIKKKQFQQKFRDENEVQNFLDQVSLDVESLTTEKKELEDALASTRERLEHYTSLESTIEKTLAAAQQTAVQMQEQAKREAELILRDADLEKMRKLNDTRIEQERIECDLMKLRTEYDMTLARMRSSLSSFSTFIGSLEQSNSLTASGGTAMPESTFSQ
jgi:cell division initiation protein